MLEYTRSEIKRKVSACAIYSTNITAVTLRGHAGSTPNSPFELFSSCVISCNIVTTCRYDQCILINSHVDEHDCVLYRSLKIHADSLIESYIVRYLSPKSA